MDNRNDCVDQILGFYGKKEELNANKLKIWLSNVLITLMKNLHENQDYTNIRNCLLLLINLFFEDIKDGDYLENLGRPSNELTNDERTLFCDLLKSEFHLDYN